jgi:REP element-mobilizing transposase RayT
MQIIRTIKSITAHKILETNPEVKKALWGGKFWTEGYYVGTVGEHGKEKEIAKYIKNQGRT